MPKWNTEVISDVLRKKKRYFNNHSVSSHRKFLHEITLKHGFHLKAVSHPMKYS